MGFSMAALDGLLVHSSPFDRGFFTAALPRGTAFPRLRSVALRRRWTDSEYCRKKKGRILDPALVTYAPHLI